MRRLKILQLIIPATCILVSSFTYGEPGKTDPKPGSNSIKYIDRSNMDLSLKPGDNFYLYANGNWLKNNPVPGSKTRWGSFDVLREESSQRLRTLLEQAAANPAKDRATQMIGEFYASGMDTVEIEARGIQPIKADLDRIDNLQNITSLLDEVARLRTLGYGSPLFGIYVGQDRKKVDQYIPSIAQGGTTLPDRDYYFKDDVRSVRVREAYRNYIKNLFGLIGKNNADAEKDADAVMQIETALAKAQYSRVEMRDPYKTYNKFAIKM
jgi:putative endopeptidase